MVVRLGAVTGVGHARLIFERFGKFWGAFSVIDLFLLNALTIVTEFIGVSLALGPNDACYIPLGHGVFHADAVADFPTYKGTGRGWIDLICVEHLDFLHHSHQVTNIIIELDGDRAASESYCTANLRIMRGDVLMQISVWNRYMDTWSKREGRWGIDARMAVIDFDEMRPVTAMSQIGRAHV